MHGVWDPLPELTVTSPYVHSRVDSNTFTMGQPYARVDFIPQSGTFDLGPFQAELRIGAYLNKNVHAPIILYFKEAIP